MLQAVKASVQVVHLTEAAHELAVQLCKRFQLSFYDAHICAAAFVAGSTNVLSEDV